MTQSQSSALNIVFVLCHEMYDNKEAIESLLAVFGFDGAREVVAVHDDVSQRGGVVPDPRGLRVRARLES